MPGRVRAAIPIWIGLSLVAVIAGVALWRAFGGHRAAPANSPVVATSQPVQVPKSRPAAPPVVSADDSYIAIVRAVYPGFAATQPLGVPLEITQAAHLILHDPIYLSGAGRPEMWITQSDAPPIDTVLSDTVDPTKNVDVHVLRDRVVFVHWMPTDNGMWPPYLICRNGDHGYEVVSDAHGRQALPNGRHYHWNRAFSWNEKVVVPTDHGLSIFRFGAEINEIYHDLVQAGAASQAASQPADYSEPQFQLDWQGLLAWLPWEPGKTGGVGAARYVESATDQSNGPSTEPAQWTDLTPANGWPAKILHLVPLLDGTILMLTVKDDNTVQIEFNALEHTVVKEDIIDKLVNDLSDPDQTVRDAAYDKLSQYGAGIWPILEKSLDGQGPEAQSRMRQLLKQKVVPTLNGMSLFGDKTLKLVARLSDGGTVFYSQAGVSIPNLDNPDVAPDYRVPAWISIRPGHAIELLPEALTSDLTEQSQLYVNGNDWIVSNDVRGPRRFVGNGFVTLLRKSEHPFSDFAGVDRRGRWVFRKPASPTTAASRETDDHQTLIIDPTLPDPIPRLPVWVLDTADEVGWTKAGWPVTKKNSAYALHEENWQLVDEKEQVFEKPEDVPPQIEPIPAVASQTQPATAPAEKPAATMPTTAPSTTQSAEPPILTDRDGTQYFGGLTELRLVPLKGKTITWTLPALATGKGSVWLVRTPDARLYLYNRPGRIIRIKPTPKDNEPFAVEKIFTHRIPTIDHPTRIWLDPAGRIDMAWDNQLAIFFPTGYIPRSIAEMMLANADDDDDQN